MKARIFILQLLLLITFQNYAQEILGVVTDKKKEPIINATVKVTQGGVLKGGGITDYDGKYSVKPLDPGLYDVTVSYTGMQPKTITGVVVTAGDRTEVNVMLEFDETHVFKNVTIKSHWQCFGGNRNNRVMTAAEIKGIPVSTDTAKKQTKPTGKDNKTN